MLHKPFQQEAVTAVSRGQDHWLEVSFASVRTSEEKGDEMGGAGLYSSKAEIFAWGPGEHTLVKKERSCGQQNNNPCSCVCWGPEAETDPLFVEGFDD